MKMPTLLTVVLVVCAFVSGPTMPATVTMSPDPATAGGVVPFAGSATATLLSGDSVTNNYVFSLTGSSALGDAYIFGFEFDNQPVGGVSVLMGANTGMTSPIESYTDDGAFIQFAGGAGLWSATVTYITVNTPTSGSLVWYEDSPLVEGSEALVFTTSAVPVPPAVWLFISGLIGLVGIARRW